MQLPGAPEHPGSDSLTHQDRCGLRTLSLFRVRPIGNDPVNFLAEIIKQTDPTARYLNARSLEETS